MIETFFLVLIIKAGTTYAPAMTTIPKPFETLALCQEAGKDWKAMKNNYWYTFDCVKHTGKSL